MYFCLVQPVPLSYLVLFSWYWDSKRVQSAYGWKCMAHMHFKYDGILPQKCCQQLTNRLAVWVQRVSEGNYHALNHPTEQSKRNPLWAIQKLFTLPPCPKLPACPWGLAITFLWSIASQTWWGAWWEIPLMRLVVNSAMLCWQLPQMFPRWVIFLEKWGVFYWKWGHAGNGHTSYLTQDLWLVPWVPACLPACLWRGTHLDDGKLISACTSTFTGVLGNYLIINCLTSVIIISKW